MLGRISLELMLEQRYLKFRSIGAFIEKSAQEQGTQKLNSETQEPTSEKKSPKENGKNLHH